jgi:hypothetical protein
MLRFVVVKNSTANAALGVAGKETVVAKQKADDGLTKKDRSREAAIYPFSLEGLSRLSGTLMRDRVSLLAIKQPALCKAYLLQ